ncbi:hypothetical protein Dimus_024061 [Dionaea muscipula]
MGCTPPQTSPSMKPVAEENQSTSQCSDWGTRQDCRVASSQRLSMAHGLQLKRPGDGVEAPEAKRRKGKDALEVSNSPGLMKMERKHVQVVRRQRVSKKKTNKGRINLVEENLMEVSVVYQESTGLGGKEAAFNNP